MKRPIKTSAAKASMAIPADSHHGMDCSVFSSGERKVIMANKGTMRRSSNNKIETIFCPGLVDNASRSPKTCITIAVEVKTKPDEQTKAISHETPNCAETMVITSAERMTCKLPKPNIWRRRLHKCDGFISKPITNRNITTPNSAMCRIACESVTNFKPNGPMINPAAK